MMLDLHHFLQKGMVQWKRAGPWWHWYKFRILLVRVDTKVVFSISRNTKLKYISRNFVTIISRNFQAKFRQIHSGEIICTKNAAKFTWKNFAFFLIAVRIEVGEMLPHITFPFGFLDRFYYLKELMYRTKIFMCFKMEKIIYFKSYVWLWKKLN